MGGSSAGGAGRGGGGGGRVQSRSYFDDAAAKEMSLRTRMGGRRLNRQIARNADGKWTPKIKFDVPSGRNLQMSFTQNEMRRRGRILSGQQAAANDANREETRLINAGYTINRGQSEVSKKFDAWHENAYQNRDQVPVVGRRFDSRGNRSA